MTTTTQKLTKTQQVLAEMLTEDTGRALCDSGGTPQYDGDGKYTGSEQGYGRSFERNRGRNFLNEAQVRLSDYGGGDFYPIINLFHWLDSRLTYDAKLTAQLKRFGAKAEYENDTWLTIVEAWPLALREHGRRVTGLYGDEGVELTAQYTYNYETCLSQDIQFLYMELDDEPVVVLQIHNGCDARGGMTAPKVFRANSSRGDLRLRPPQRCGGPAEGRSGAAAAVRAERAGEGVVVHRRRQPLLLRGLRAPREAAVAGEVREVGESRRPGHGVVYFDTENRVAYCPVTGWPLLWAF
jgi:hypothetical protein